MQSTYKYLILFISFHLLICAPNSSSAKGIFLGAEQGLSSAYFYTGDIATNHIRWIGLLQAGVDIQSYELSLRFGYSPALTTALDQTGANANELPVFLSVMRLFERQNDWTHGLGLIGGAIYSLSSGDDFDEKVWIPEYGVSAQSEYGINEQLRTGIRMDILLQRGLNINLTCYWRF